MGCRPMKACSVATSPTLAVSVPAIHNVQLCNGELLSFFLRRCTLNTVPYNTRGGSYRRAQACQLLQVGSRLKAARCLTRRVLSLMSYWCTFRYSPHHLRSLPGFTRKGTTSITRKGELLIGRFRALPVAQLHANVAAQVYKMATVT